MTKPASDIRPYRCADCGAEGVRLYRPYSVMLSGVVLRCTACTRKKEGDSVEFDPACPDSIGWSVAAVPCIRSAEGPIYYDLRGSFWGFTSIPDDGVAWWRGLPVEAPQADNKK